MDEFKIGELFNKFYGELASKTRLTDTGEMLFSIFSQININEPLISSMKVFCWKNSIMKANRRIS